MKNTKNKNENGRQLSKNEENDATSIKEGGLPPMVGQLTRRGRLKRFHGGISGFIKRIERRAWSACRALWFKTTNNDAIVTVEKMEKGQEASPHINLLFVLHLPPPMTERTMDFCTKGNPNHGCPSMGGPMEQVDFGAREPTGK
ncbi:hypothetical protein M9H77_21571 [Catharanthus roseus]|uniref:Uncharacterized protein n=1 Tax=Catharanthus roseus TaxID=4058 RepID=A0ACC0AMQ4_CATRO|nr:hypothetical protein M9H77_21571 [Catharanthus roseus]